MTEDKIKNVQGEGGVDIIDVITNWRRRFKRLSSDKLLVFIRHLIEKFNNSSEKTRAPRKFAKELLFAYKVGSAVSADDYGHVPFGVTYCFKYRDANLIIDNDPKLLSRRFLCTLKNHDFIKEDIAQVVEILDLLESYTNIKTPNREPIHLQTKHVRRNSIRGAFRNVMFSKRRLPQTEISTDPIYHFSRFQIR